MSDKSDKPSLVWDRPEPPRRPAPSPLSREAIVQAALALADAEGLEAVSLRRVGAALGAGPMRLYGYVATKEELLDLLVDAVYAEMESPSPARSDWRKALRHLALQTRRVARAHPWFVALLGGRPRIGPNALAHMEASLAALVHVPGFESIDDVIQAVGTVNAFVIGALHSEASELRAETASGMTETEWHAAVGPYIERMVATGRYPTVARVVRDAKHAPADVAFENGLECVLDGVALRLAARTNPTKRRK